MSDTPAPISPGSTVTPLTPITSTTSVTTPPPKPPLASRDVFFPLSLYTRPVSPPSASPSAQPAQLSSSLPSCPPTPYEVALNRVEQLNEFLTPSMKCTLSSMLSVVHTHLSPPPSAADGLATAPHSLVTTVASAEQSGNQIKDLVDIIEAGLLVFAALGGGSSVKQPSQASTMNQTSETGASAGPRKRQRIGSDGRLVSSFRSHKVRRLCGIRDPNCQICNAKAADVSHIIPYSVKDKKAIDFWKFVELFRGAKATMALKAIALAPNPESVDNLKNVWTLCKSCHDYFGHGKLAMIPDLDGLSYPYDPNSTSTYTAVIEFPCGDEGVGIASWRHEAGGRVRLVGQMDEGDLVTLSTHNAPDLPLPHPLLFQLHAIISRVIGMKAAARFAMFPDIERGSPDDYGVPAFIDNTYLEWMAQHFHKDKPAVTPVVLNERYDSNSTESHILRWFKLTPAPPLGKGIASSDFSESDCDMEINAQESKKRDHFEDSDTDEELPRKYTVVLSEVGQRMDEKWQLARRRLEEFDECEEEFASCWGS